MIWTKYFLLIDGLNLSYRLDTDRDRRSGANRVIIHVLRQGQLLGDFYL
jgi:hypothetical protein